MANTASSELREESSDPLASARKKWASARLKHLVQINPDSISGKEPDEWEIQYVDISSVNGRGEVEEVDSMPFDEAPSRAQRLVRDGDTIVSTVRTYLKAIAHVEDPPSNMVVSTGFAVLRPSDKLIPRFVWRTLQAKPFVDWIVANSEGVSYPAIAPQRLGELVIPRPPIEKQQMIAEFLDQRTARIDALVEKQKRLLDLLDEKRQAVITQAVTKGLDSTVATKSTDVEWLGEIPEHWDAVKVAYLNHTLHNGHVGSTNDILASEGTRYIQSLHIKNNKIIFDPPYYVDPEWAENSSKSEILHSDVLVVQTGDIGQVAVVPQEYNGAHCHALIIIRPRKSVVTGPYLSWVLNSTYGINKLKQVETGALHPHLNCADVREVKVPLPSVKEQKAICSDLSKNISDVESSKSKIEQSISLLKEKRQALITAAVTGQIDVTEERGEIRDSPV